MLLVLSVLLLLSSADMPLFLLAGVFLYCYWYQLLDMLLLLLMLMDYLLDRTQKRIGLIGRVVDRMNTQLRHHGSDGCPTFLSLPSQ